MPSSGTPGGAAFSGGRGAFGGSWAGADAALAGVSVGAEVGGGDAALVSTCWAVCSAEAVGVAASGTSGSSLSVYPA